MAIAALSAIVLIGTAVSPDVNVVTMIVAGLAFTLSLTLAIRLLMDPDSVRARQSDAMLQLSSSTLDLMQDGLTSQAAQDICELLLPSTAAIAVAITDTEQVLGYAGFQEADNPVGSDIRTQATHDTIADGSIRVLYCSEDIGFPKTPPPSRPPSSFPSRWATPSRGTLKFYYHSAKKITETQKSIAQGFGKSCFPRRWRQPRWSGSASSPPRWS